MGKLVFFRRRSLMLPTLPGTLVIFFILIFLAYLLFTNVGKFLAVNQPVGGEYLVIEGWLGKAELSEARRIFDAHDYKFAIVSGGPITDEFNLGPPNYAERASKYLISIGFPEHKLAAVPAPYSAQDRTFLSAVIVRDWYSEQSIAVNSMDVFTSGIHSRRSRDLYRLAFGEDFEIGVYASKPEDFDLNRWWESSDAAKSILSELLAWIFVKCCFDPGPRGSHSEMWGTF